MKGSLLGGNWLRKINGFLFLYLLIKLLNSNMMFGEWKNVCLLLLWEVKKNVDSGLRTCILGHKKSNWKKKKQKMRKNMKIH